MLTKLAKKYDFVKNFQKIVEFFTLNLQKELIENSFLCE